jgi:hypothetical protein
MSDPLERIAAQLAVAADRKVARSRRRRMARTSALACLLALGLASAASAITGVGPADDLIDPDSTRATVEPAQGEPHVTVEQVGADATVWNMRAYRAGDARFCVQAPSVGMEWRSEIECWSSASLADSLERRGLALSVGAPDEGRDVNLIFGIARADAIGVDFAVAGGPGTRAAISDVWAESPSGAAGGVPLRAFLAVLEGPTPYVDRPLHVRVELAEGGTLDFTWP